jgi:hypothetical protein
VPPTGDRRGSDIVHDLFGVTLQQQGRGFYVVLEMLAIARGVLQESRADLLSPGPEAASYRRVSHDLARRIATNTPIADSELMEAIQGEATLGTLEALMSSLVVAVPGRRRAPRWFAAHLYPFVGELIHYDAVERRGRPAVERYVFRDGGGWAYHVLRTDTNTFRREKNRDGLESLITDSHTALGRVAAALHSHDSTQPTELFVDTSERKCETKEEQSPWPDLMRQGVHGIVSRSSSSRAKRIEQLMHWVPYCLARHQLRLARTSLGRVHELIPIDASHSPNPLRTRSQHALDEFRWDISAALTNRATQLRDSSASNDASDWDRWARYAQVNAPFTSSPRAFFSETLAAVGALNATTGRRHFTLKAPMLEALVAALVPPNEEMEFHTFCAIAFGELSLVVDQRAARKAGLTDAIDEGVFVANAEAFRSRLAAIGLLTHYSDATSLVHGEAR